MSQDQNQTPPRVYNELKPWLQNHYTNLPKRLQVVAEFALQNPDVVALSTIAVISERAGVTPSTLIRFAKTLGYQGFSDMQAVFQESMQHVAKPYSQRINYLQEHGDGEQTVLRRFTRAAMASIDRLDQQIDQSTLVQASQTLANASTIYLAGQGRATPVVTYLHYTFVKLGIQAVILDGMAGSATDKAHLIRPDEALLAISFTPYTANTRDLVAICAQRDIPIVAITDSTLSPIARQDNLHLEVIEEEVGDIRGLSATMCLAISLAVETGRQTGKQRATKH